MKSVTGIVPEFFNGYIFLTFAIKFRLQLAATVRRLSNACILKRLEIVFSSLGFYLIRKFGSAPAVHMSKVLSEHSLFTYHLISIYQQQRYSSSIKAERKDMV